VVAKIVACLYGVPPHKQTAGSGTFPLP
jgi:hypothetical protein